MSETVYQAESLYSRYDIPYVLPAVMDALRARKFNTEAVNASHVLFTVGNGQIAPAGTAVKSALLVSSQHPCRTCLLSWFTVVVPSVANVSMVYTCQRIVSSLQDADVMFTGRFDVGDIPLTEVVALGAEDVPGGGPAFALS